MATEIRTEVARFDRDDPVLAQLRRDGTARLRFSRPLIEFLDELSIRMNTPIEELLTQAVGLFKVAVDAQARGETVCLLDDDLDIVAEITGLGASETAGVTSFAAIGVYRDDR